MQALIKQTVVRLRSEAVSAQSYQRKAADLIESQAAEIAKYKALCDQMACAIEDAESTGTPFSDETLKAIEAWRAMK